MNFGGCYRKPLLGWRHGFESRRGHQKGGTGRRDGSTTSPAGDRRTIEGAWASIGPVRGLGRMGGASPDGWRIAPLPA
jgi:hypothetical protein